MKDYSEVISRLIQEIINAETPKDLKMAQEKLKSLKILSSLQLNDIKRELQELKKQIDVGKLLPIHEVENLLSERALFLKETLYSLPRQLSITLENKSRREIMEIIRKAIDNMLEYYTRPVEEQVNERKEMPKDIDVG